MRRIEFEYDGAPYICEFDADTIKQTEKEYELNFLTLGAQTLSAPEKLFMGSLIKHHPKLEKAKALEMYKALSPVMEDGTEEHKEENTLFYQLVLMATDAINNIAKPSGNAKWKVAGN